MNDDKSETPEEVAEVLQAFALHITGHGPAPDFDALDDDTRDMVDQLLPAIVELVGDRIVPADELPDWDDGATIDGARLRAAREAAHLNPQELAVQVSRRGKTIAAGTIEAFETSIETSVDPDLRAAIADALGVSERDLVPDTESLERTVIEDIVRERPGCDVSYDRVPLDASMEPLFRLTLTDFDLIARVVVFDIVVESELRHAQVLAVAAALSRLAPETAAFLLVAGADPERSTQIVDDADLRQGFTVPGGERLAAPRRHPVLLRDAVRALFEELNPDWEDEELDLLLESDLDAPGLARACAADGIGEATKSKVRLAAKIDAFDAIGEPETDGLAGILGAIRGGDVAPGTDFRRRFEDDLVGAR